MRKLHILVFFVLFPFFGMEGKTGMYDKDLVFHSLTVRDGLPQISIMDIAQDSEGFIWFATRGGVARYDGFEFKCFQQSDEPGSLVENYCTSLLPYQNGDLWVGTTRGLFRYLHDDGTFVPYRINGKSSSISKIFQTRFGEIFAISKLGLARYDAVSDSFTSIEGADQYFKLITDTPDEDVLLLATGTQLFSFSLSKHELTEVNSIPGRAEFLALNHDRRDNIYVGTLNDGLFRLDRDFNLTARYTVPEINSNYIRALSVDNSGNILIGTYDGLNILCPEDGKIWSYRISRESNVNALSFFSIISLACSSDNTVWIGSYPGGVNYFNPDEYGLLEVEHPSDRLDGLVGNVGHLVSDSRGVWIGMQGDGLIYRSNEGTYSRVPLGKIVTDHRSNIVSGLYMDKGNLWVGFNDGNLIKYDVSRKKVTGRYHISTFPVIAMCSDIDGNLYVGSWCPSGEDNLSVVKKDGSVTAYSMKEISSMAVLPDGTLLIGERDGTLLKWDTHLGKVIWKYNVNLCVNDIYIDGEENIWVASYNMGVLKFSPSLELTDSFSTSDGLHSKCVNAVSSGSDGIIWVSTPSAVSSINPLTREVRSWQSPYVNEFTARSVTSSGGEIYLGADKCLVRVNPFKGQVSMNATAPSIIDVLVDGEPAAGTTFNKASYLSFYFRSLEYSGKELVRYSYMLQGLDNGWKDVSSNPRVNIANLPAGKYVFRTRAFKGPYDEKGVEGESFSFRINVPVFARWWMILAYFLVLAAAGLFVLYWFRARRSLDEEREKLRRICENLCKENIEAGESQESDFMKKVYSCINSHLGESSFGIDVLISEIGASRTGLYYKIKKNTGLPPMDFVRKVRLDVASQLLLEGRYSITEIAEKVGFCNGGHFTNSFKKQFGCTPREYIKNTINNK